VFIRGRSGGVFPVQQVLATPWRKSVSAGDYVQGVLQRNAAADQGFLHEGSTTLRFGGLYVATLLDRHHPSKTLPKSRTARRTALGRGPHPQGLAIFLTHVFVIRPGVTSSGKTSCSFRVIFFYSFLSPGLVSLSNYFFS
jgi:hypothetical protein